MENSASPEYALSRYSSVLSSPIRVKILKKMASMDQPPTEILSVEGFTTFTVKQNLRYLKRHGMISGHLTIRHLSYSIDSDHRAEFKNLMDEWFLCVTKKP